MMDHQALLTADSVKRYSPVQKTFELEIPIPVQKSRFLEVTFTGDMDETPDGTFLSETRRLIFWE
jgi:hypothetical protein